MWCRYGLSKFISGVVGAKFSPTFLLAGGLMLTAAVNIAFGFGASLAWFCFFWALNGTLQVGSRGLLQCMFFYPVCKSWGTQSSMVCLNITGCWSSSTTAQRCAAVPDHKSCWYSREHTVPAHTGHSSVGCTKHASCLAWEASHLICVSACMTD
jgi:sugar phosphate permease